MSLLVTPKFKYHRNSKSLASFGDRTNIWSNTHSYRTNYRDMATKVGYKILKIILLAFNH